MDQNIRKRPKLKLWVRLILSIIIIIGIFLPLFEISIHSIKVNNSNTNDIIYTYRVDKNLNYKVQLYENNFTDNTEMGANKVYISDLVKNIKTNFSYVYSGTNKTKLKYTYNIKAKLTGESQSNQTTGTNDVVWEKDYTLLDNVQKNTDSNGFAINEILNIDYPKYKEEVLNFRKKFGMALTTKLRITMTINVSGNYQEEAIKKQDKIIMDIPVGTQAFSIKEDYKKQDVKELYKKNKSIQIENNSYTIICLIITFTSIILFIMTFKAIFNIKPKDAYTKKLEKILKTYGQVIVEVKTQVKEKGYNIVIVKNFDEMLDLEEELRIPIIFYESVYNNAAVFTIAHENTIYKYVLKG